MMQSDTFGYSVRKGHRWRGEDAAERPRVKPMTTDSTSIDGQLDLMPSLLAPRSLEAHTTASENSLKGCSTNYK
jgi:hypothetical protein